jgi:FkbM family methyltransferase
LNLKRDTHKMFDFIKKSELWNALDAGLLKEIQGKLSFQLKTIQDLWVYSVIKDEQGKSIAEIGGGESRILPRLALNNDCYNIEKFEGEYNGPNAEICIHGVKNIKTFVGEFSSELEENSFDILFSVSVVEHVTDDKFADFFNDCIRILKPGGYMVHAIDMYIPDEPSMFLRNRYEMYKNAVLNTSLVEPLGSIREDTLAFSCDMASNPDNIMYGWKKLAPALDQLRQGAQSVSLKLGVRKVSIQQTKKNMINTDLSSSIETEKMKNIPVLSIAIPAYNRSKELELALTRFISQIEGKYETEIEIIISDDCSPNNSLHNIELIAKNYSFIKYKRYTKNVGLEHNLIKCTEDCTGEYLWIFGDDDFIELDDGLDYIMQFLRQGQYDFFILNRTRRSFDLSKLISDNWMQLDTNKNYEFSGLREFFLKHGFISIIGFISVNIFKRVPFQKIDASKYFGTMYPQLGAMAESFHDCKTLLIGLPLVCHRTQTQEEKKAALGTKKSEADFMADKTKRDAMYFSHPYIAMLDELISKKAFTPQDIIRIPENTVINGLLIDFLIRTVELNHELIDTVDNVTWLRTAQFFNQLPLDSTRRNRINATLSQYVKTEKLPQKNQQHLTISVITPSYNQAEFLEECLLSVKNQTYPPIEHFVFDPGSTDNSRAIASNFAHIKLIAEPDEGQSDALNKGFQRAKGDIIAWLNSDDCFAHPNVFERVIQRFLEPDSPDIVYGKGIYIDEKGNKLRDVYINKNPTSFAWRFQHEDGVLQPALFMKRSVIEKVGLLRNDLHYSMDYEYWIRCMKANIKFAYVDEDFAIARYHQSNKTYGMRGNSYSEVCDMMKEHFAYVNHLWLKRYAEFLVDGHDGVLASSSNSGISNEIKLKTIYRELLLDYNTSYDTYQHIVQNAQQKSYGDTYREMQNLAITPQTPCKPIPLKQEKMSGYCCYTVAERRWAFDLEWKNAQIQKSHNFLIKQILERKNDTCIIVGNGPSLNNTDLSLLKDQDVIVSNNVFLSKELMAYATYFTTVNYLVAEQSSHHINRIKHIYKILPYWLSYCINPSENTFFVDAVGYPEFSKDMFQNMSWRHTVTFFNLHLAYGLGYRRVIMIGFDHNYTQPKEVVEQDIIQDFAADVNHFHSGYFRGKKWQAADVDMMEEMYRLAKTAFEEDGREIINATVGGKLELFSRMRLEDALDVNKNPIKTSPILIGQLPRSVSAHWDETNAIAYLFSQKNTGCMIDVGAHFGTALAPFLEKNWKIFAFEPDEQNRQKLLQRLANHPYANNVKLDTRAVSDKSQQGLNFYRSEESTGVSGLSAFLSSHKAAQTVDTVTLTEVLADEAIETIDFLKIDTEGHDLFVLKGFPWERFKPAVIECEFEDSKTVSLGYTFHDLAKYLVDKGYTVYVSEWHPIIRYGIRHDWRQLSRYPCELADEKGWGNLLAFRDGIDEGKLVEVVRSMLNFTKPITKQAAKPIVASKIEKMPITAFVNSEELLDILLLQPYIQFSRYIISEGFNSIANHTWQFVTNPQPSEEKQSLWMAIFNVKKQMQGKSLTAAMTISATENVTLRITFARHGSETYEGTGKTVTLNANQQNNIEIQKTFAQNCDALKVQIEVLKMENIDCVELEIQSVNVSLTSLVKICQNTSEKELNIATANYLFRQKNYEKALDIYLLLYSLYFIKMYADNVLMCIRKLGIRTTYLFLTQEHLTNLIEKRREEKRKHILVYTMGKVGSSSIRYTLTQHYNYVYHLHSLDRDKLQALDKKAEKRGVKNTQKNHIQTVQAVYANGLHNNSAIITVVREPIARNISAFFQNLHTFLPNNESHSVNNIIEEFLSSYAHTLPLTWFDDELKTHVGISVYSEPFPKDKGYMIIQQGNISLLVLKLEISDTVKEAALREFLDNPDIELVNTNIGAEKDYSELYAEVKKQIVFDDDYINMMYSSKFMRHFYTEQEIEKFRKKWQRS